MNPEFRRQLWLQFSPTRLGVLPVVLAACFVAAFHSTTQHPAQAMAVTGAVLFVFLVVCMGTFAAGASVIDEITDHTWDQQRMSAMQPWAMTWGKLAGASAYGWYGGALCLLVAVPSAMWVEDRTLVVQVTALLVSFGVFLQALLMAVNLQLVKVGGPLARRGAFWAVVLVLGWGLASVLGIVRGEMVGWWGQTFNRLDFGIASMFGFAACALVAAWRSMADVLAVRQFPWAWPTLALLATAYVTGFSPDAYLPVFGLVGLTTSAVFTYFAVLTEPQQRPHWQRLVNHVRASRWSSALQQMPRWPTTLVLAVALAVLLTLKIGDGTRLTWAFSPALLLHPVSVVLLMARDCVLALFFAFSPSGRRPTMAFLVLMLVMYAVLPWLVGATANPGLVGIVQPLLATGALSPVFAVLHLALALGLLRWRWLATAGRNERSTL